MSVLNVICWVATLATLITYARLARGHNPHHFHLANALAFPPLVVLNALAHTWQAVVLNVGFGVPAVYAVVSHWWEKRKVAAWTGRLNENDPWDGAEPFKGIDIRVDPAVPEGMVYLINTDYLIGPEPFVFQDDLAGDEANSDEMWAWYREVYEDTERRRDARIAIIGTGNGS